MKIGWQFNGGEGRVLRKASFTNMDGSWMGHGWPGHFQIIFLENLQSAAVQAHGRAASKH